MSLGKRAGAEFIGTFWLAPLAGAMLAGVVYRWFETDSGK